MAPLHRELSLFRRTEFHVKQCQTMLNNVKQCHRMMLSFFRFLPKQRKSSTARCRRLCTSQLRTPCGHLATQASFKPKQPETLAMLGQPAGPAGSAERMPADLSQGQNSPLPQTRQSKNNLKHKYASCRLPTMLEDKRELGNPWLAAIWGKSRFCLFLESNQMLCQCNLPARCKRVWLAAVCVDVAVSKMQFSRS